MARAKLFPIDVVRPQESGTASWDWLIRRPCLAANRAGQKRSPDRRQVLRSGLPTWRVEVTLRPPPRDPLKRDSHTLVRLCFSDKDARSKEKHCDIFATIKAVTPQSNPAKRQLNPAASA
jgi:hypothetical protein